jgi:hypothetical protein
LRPSAVAMRARKPCVRARLSLLGWKVRFMVAPKGMDVKRLRSMLVFCHQCQIQRSRSAVHPLGPRSEPRMAAVRLTFLPGVQAPKPVADEYP